MEEKDRENEQTQQIAYAICDEVMSISLGKTLIIIDEK